MGSILQLSGCTLLPGVIPDGDYNNPSTFPHDTRPRIPLAWKFYQIVAWIRALRGRDKRRSCAPSPLYSWKDGIRSWSLTLKTRLDTEPRMIPISSCRRPGTYDSLPVTSGDPGAAFSTERLTINTNNCTTTYLHHSITMRTDASLSVSAAMEASAIGLLPSARLLTDFAETPLQLLW